VPITIAASTIAQEAFRLMEIAPLSSFSDQTPQAQAAAEQYPTALDACLEREDWSFARRLVRLPLATDPSDGQIADPELPYFYSLPGDTVKLRWVQSGVRWRIDETYICADLSGGLMIRYTRRIENEARLPATFRTAVAYELAVLLAPQFVKHRTKRADLVSEGSAALERAVKQDAKSASFAAYDDAAAGDWAGGATR